MSDSATPWTVACQAPLSKEIPRQEYWLPFPPPGDHYNPRIKPASPALAGGFFTTKTPEKPLKNIWRHYSVQYIVWNIKDNIVKNMNLDFPIMLLSLYLVEPKSMNTQ